MKEIKVIEILEKNNTDKVIEILSRDLVENLKKRKKNKQIQ